MFVLAPKNGGAYKKAAEEFCKLYKQVTGIAIEIKYTPSETEDMVIIGTEAVQPYCFDILEGGFPVRIGADDYYIISKEDNGRNLLFLGGGRGRSALYSVYDFFERRANCHYFWDGDVIPHQDSIDITNLYVVEKPRFEYRAIRYFAHRGLTRFQAEHWDFDEWKQELDWALKARLNTFMLRIGMDDVFQKAFPDIVPYPPTDKIMPGAGEGYNNRTTSWSLEYRGELRKKILDYAFECDFMHPEDFGTMTHWYSRTPIEFLEKAQPKLMSQTSSTYSEQTGQVWDIFDEKNIENYLKLTDTHVENYGKAELFHTIGLAERSYNDDRKKNLELKKFAYKRFFNHIYEKYPNAKILVATWDFFFKLNPEEVNEIVKMFDPEKTIMLDYTADLKCEDNNLERWGIMGKIPWIFGIFHGYMPQTYVHGDYEYLNKKIAAADADPKCKGMDFWPELSHSDTLMLTYFAKNAWRPTPCNLPEFVKEFCYNRYGEHADKMWDVWQTYLPIINLHNINRQTYAYSPLRNDFFTYFPKTGVEEHLNEWRKEIEYSNSFNKDVITLLQKVKALPAEVLNNKFAMRDCMDLMRSAISQILQICYVDTCIAYMDLQKGEGDADRVLKALDFYSSLMDSFGDLLYLHDDYSMYKTLCDQAKNRPINPAFADTLKDNLLNNYCRTAAFELVRFVYCKEITVFSDWIKSRIAENNLESLLPESFPTERERIFNEFKALPFEEMQKYPAKNFAEAIDGVLKVIS